MNKTGYKMCDNRDFTSKRPHLTKDERMPKCYKDVEKIIKSVQSCRNNFKTVMANSRFRGGHFKKVYSLSLNVLKYYNYIQKIIDKTEILKKETFLRRETTSILIYELIYGKGYLPGGNKVVTIVQSYENDIFKAHEELKNSTAEGELNEIYIPRYVRVHTLKTTVAYVIKDLKSYGFKQVLYEGDISEEKYLELVRYLEKGTFIVDFHFKDILVFAQDENLIELDLYKDGHIFLQDKASYIPVHVLNPEPGSTVLDACAAPGMKSAHIASKMENKGTLIACERDKKRFEILKDTLEYGSVKIAKTLCADFKSIDPSDETYSSVEYILLDPSCSGSGMVNRMDEVTNNEDSTSKERIQKLAGFQIILLKHALKFPSVKRVVYSTCSIHEEENEYVVHEALSAFAASFKLVPALPELFSRGSGNYQYSEMCLRTVPSKHLTNGFFVAVFERIECRGYEDKYSKKYKRFKSSRDDSEHVYSPDRKPGYSLDKKTKSMRNFKQEKESCDYGKSNENNFLDTVDTEGNSERVIRQEEGYECGKLNETNQYSLNDEDGSKEKNYHDNANVENVIKCKSHKKKCKKSKYSDQTNIEGDEEQIIDTHHYKGGKQMNDFSDSFPKYGGASMVQDPVTLQMSSELDDTMLQGKKSKHKKSHKSQKSFGITEDCESVSDHKSKKKKKRKYSEISSSDTFPLEEQNSVANSDILDVIQVSKSNDRLNKNSTEETTDLIAGEENSPPKKHKKKKKKKDHELDESAESWKPNKVPNADPLDVLNPENSAIVNVNFSSQENSDILQTRDIHFDDNDLKQTKSKKHKHKKHARKTDCDVSPENLYESVSPMTMKETSQIDGENTVVVNPNENNYQDIKRTKKKSKKDKSDEYLNDFNKSFQSIEPDASKKLLGEELDAVTVQNEFSKRKKSKKHKSHSKDV